MGLVGTLAGLTSNLVAQCRRPSKANGGSLSRTQAEAAVAMLMRVYDALIPAPEPVERSGSAGVGGTMCVCVCVCVSVCVCVCALVPSIHVSV